MKLKIIILIVFILPLITIGQKYHFDFQKLNIIDTISSQEKIEKLRKDFRFDNIFVHIIKNQEKEDVTVLIYKKDNLWVVAVFEVYSSNTSSRIINVSKDNRYAYVISQGSISPRQTESTYKNLRCIDMQKNQFFSWDYYNYMFYWEPSNVTDFEFEKMDYLVDASKIVINEKYITILNSFFGNSDRDQQQSDVIQSGEYRIEEKKVIKTKNYDSESMQLKPVIYMGDIAVGMSTQEVKELLPNAKFLEKENQYDDCTEDNVMGFEIWEGDEHLCYTSSALSGGIINNLIVLAPKFWFGGIHVGSTLAQVLKLYPNARIVPNLLSDWETIFIKDLAIEVTFRTNNMNRIAVLKDEDFIKWQNKKNRVDFIRLLQK